MKRFLKKRWLGIPVGIVSIVLVLVLLGGSALALTGWFQVLTGTADVTVDEAITIGNVTGDDGDFDPSNNTWSVSIKPGEMKKLYIEVSNASQANLSVVATYTITPSGVGITVTGNDGVALNIPETVPGASSGVFAIEVHAAGSANIGSYTVNFALHRQ